ncbi:hypothetical protein HB662_18290 [Roseomonas frigidaquae]|uniref:Uncharacterized protein n=1 Tax=Falsiroseomonas frigidaquae TaxID=487318 RepID=A0ABX1F2Z5_9PROT|nr:hypothetical protein [Falsiroseomonas frigidaquae]NKE46736.1 hypothetical protein [Falsiroseomonas frigidaquae]
MPRAILALILALQMLMLPAGRVQAQTLQSLVVGADVAVVVPPRGAAVLRPLVSPAASAVEISSLPMTAGAAAGTGLAAGALPFLLPIAAAVALGGGLPGSGGSGTAPASTR